MGVFVEDNSLLMVLTATVGVDSLGVVAPVVSGLLPGSVPPGVVIVFLGVVGVGGVVVVVGAVVVVEPGVTVDTVSPAVFVMVIVVPAVVVGT